MSEPLHPDQLRAGHAVRDFRVVRRLGVGGFAFVFLMEREGRSFSMKVAARPASEADEDRVDEWMRREVLSLESVVHPHLLPVLEWGRWPDPEAGYGYFVTPYVAGSTFHAWRWRERASLHRTVGVLCDVLRPLEALHERGMCHRDLKADNVLVRQGDDWPFLIDFGAAHLPGARPLTEGLAPGTLYCQPPEAIAFLVSKAARQGSRLPSRPAADLYAFGVLLYETLTNCRPFSTQLSLEELLVSIAATPPLEPQRLAPDAPASLCALVWRLLAKEPGQRPLSARAVREELERLRKEEGHTPVWQSPARPPSEDAGVKERFPDVDLLEDVREALPEPPPPPPSVETPSLTLPQRASRWPRLLVALALGLGLLGLGWALFSEKGTQSVPAPHSAAPDLSPTSTPVPSRLCALLTNMLGVAAAQLAGCATAPVRPDPIGYFARCSPEARATPVKLGLTPEENPSFFDSGTPASDESIRDGGSLNLKPGPVTATIYVEMKGQEVEMRVTGEAMTMPHRVYIQFDWLHLPDGSSLPICGVAVDGLHQYGLPTYAKLPIRRVKVDPAKVDKSPGSVVLNHPRFEIVLVGPEGYPVPPIDFAPPDWR
ncbi:MAG TPA: serine/threonine-protein kinase [Archangium sp.]|jgi:serine/threonine-protein kinase|uniref:serine/threonine protein kinase n=1 Tax=Archangium sp. TaxID=1872627 RepID=UPI002EDA4171